MPESKDVWIDGLRAYVSTPNASTKTGVLMLPMVSGISEAVRGFAERIADAGLAAVVWDPYSSHFGADQLTQFSTSLRDMAVRGEQVRWLDYMTSDLKLASVGVMGWCMGGRYALLLAASDARVRACVAYYPSIREQNLPHQDEDVLARVRDIACPAMVIYPGKDHVTSWPTFRKLRDQLETRCTTTAIHIHPRADHNFLARTEGHNRAAAAESWPQMLAFLCSELLEGHR